MSKKEIQELVAIIKSHVDCRKLVKHQGIYAVCPVCHNMMNYSNKSNRMYCPKCGCMDSLNLLSLSLGYEAVPRGKAFFRVLETGAACAGVHSKYFGGSKILGADRHGNYDPDNMILISEGDNGFIDAVAKECRA